MWQINACISAKFDHWLHFSPTRRQSCHSPSTYAIADLCCKSSFCRLTVHVRTHVLPMYTWHTSWFLALVQYMYISFDLPWFISTSILSIPANLFSIIILMGCECDSWSHALKYEVRTAGRPLFSASRLHAVRMSYRITRPTEQCSTYCTLYVRDTVTVQTPHAHSFIPHTHWLLVQ